MRTAEVETDHAGNEQEQNYWYALWRGVVQALIATCQRDGLLDRDIDAGREADALVALVDGLGIQATFEPDRLPPEEQISLIDRHLARLASGA